MAKRKSKTYEEKLKIIKFIEDNPLMKKCDVAKKFSIKRQTLNDLIKKADKIKTNVEIRRGQYINFKRVRSIRYENVDAALILWFHQHLKDPETQMTVKFLQMKANHFATEFGHDAKITWSWIDRWKKRWGVNRILQAEQCQNVIEDTMKKEKEAAVKNILENYESDNIYHVGETKLFWQLLPENSLEFVRQKTCWHGNKQSNSHITLLVGVNMSGTNKLPLLAIGKSNYPSTLNNMKSLPVNYIIEENACLSSSTLEQYLHDLDKKIKSHGRKIVILLDNSSAHLDIKLENIKLAFLAQSVTSKMLPLNGGIIRNFKLHYRHVLSSLRLQAAESAQNFKWSLLDCLLAVQSAWSSVTCATIVDCFHHTGFIHDDQFSGIESSSSQAGSLSENELAVFQEIWDDLQDMVGDVSLLEEYIDVDNEVDSTGPMNDQEIVAAVSKDPYTVKSEDNNGDDNDEMIVDRVEPVPTLDEAIQAVDFIRSFAFSMDNAIATEDILQLTTTLKQKLLQEKALKPKEVFITDQFCV